MLKLLRDQFKNLKLVLWFVVFVFVLLIFMDWGGGGADRSQRGLEGVAAKVGSTTITEAQFLRELRGTEERFRKMYGEQYEAFRRQLDIPTMTLQSMVDRTLLIEAAERMGLAVADSELMTKVMSFPVFKKEDGSFVGQDMYARFLRGNQTTPEEFESSLRQEMVLEKLQQAMAVGVMVSDQEIRDEYRRRNETASGDALFLPLDRFLAQVASTDVEAKAFYDANSARFSHPEQWQVRYLLVDRSRLRRTLSIPEKQIEEYYQSHLGDFRADEEVNARHILIKPATPDAAGEQAALTRAQDVWKRAAAGADFAELARQLSDDEGSKASGGDVGFFARGRMVKEFEDVAFALPAGQVSEPVKTQFGYHVIKAEGRKPAGQKTLDEVRESIRTTLSEALADGEGSRRAGALREKIDAAKLTSEDQWKALADDTVTSNLTPFFERSEFLPGLGRDPELMAEIAGAKVGFIGGPRRTQRGWMVYRVAEIRKAGVTPFEEAKVQATESVKREKAVEAARVALESRRAALLGGDLQAEAGSLGGKVERFTDHRRGMALPTVGTSQAVDDAIFSTPVPALTPVVAVADRGAMVARITAQKLADPVQLEKDKASLRDGLVQQEVQRLQQALLAETRRSRTVTINNDILSRFKPGQE